MSRRTSTRAGNSKSNWNIFEPLEGRQMLAAHIQGNATVYNTIQAAVDAAAPAASSTSMPARIRNGFRSINR